MANSSSITGIVGCWTLHILTEFVDSAIFALRYPGAIPVKLTGLVVKDNRGRFPAGTAMQSNLVRGIDLQNMLIHTLNSTYQLKGAGSFSYVHSQRYGFEIEVAMALATKLKSKITIH